MEIKDIIKMQDEFDRKHASKIEWATPITEENIEMLEFLLVCIMGEVGEFANITKKIRRGDLTLNSEKENLAEEAADIFIYLIKICNQAGIDLEESFLKKVNKNQQRFKKYQKE